MDHQDFHQFLPPPLLTFGLPPFPTSVYFAGDHPSQQFLGVPDFPLQIKCPKLEHGGMPTAGFQNSLSPGIYRLPALQYPAESRPEVGQQSSLIRDKPRGSSSGTPIWSGRSAPPNPAQVIINAASRKRRKTLSERIRVLASLMPWDKKMATGEMLEEAHKYVRFLEAQLAALQHMPEESYFPPPSQLPSGNGVGEDCWRLETLSRQQLLQVVVNSPLVQSRLYERGCCVYSAEQVALLRRIAEWKALEAGSGSSASN